MKTLKPYFVNLEHEKYVRVVRVITKERGLKPRDFIELGLAEPYGCTCSHCAADWDCCGNFFPAFIDVQKMRDGYKLSQTYMRNC